MRSDTIIRQEGYEAIFNRLDIAEAERFIALMRRDNFDYTEWRQSLFSDMTLKELSNQAIKHWKTGGKNK